jgi:hypothetical protein
VPHLKCVACRIRLRSASGGKQTRCPGCGLPLEPVLALEEIVGFARAGDAPHDVAVAGHRRIAVAVAEIIARKSASGPSARGKGSV